MTICPLPFMGLPVQTTMFLAVSSSQTHYDQQFAEYQQRLQEYQADPIGEPPEPPQLGAIGMTLDGNIYVDTGFAFELTMPYTFNEDCIGGNIPGLIQICYTESDPNETVVRTDGIAGDYAVDAGLAATSVEIVSHSAPINLTIFLVPEN